MRSPLAWVAVASVAMAFASVSGPEAAAAKAPASPVVAACASERLPREILEGPIAEPKSPLPTIDVAAPGAMLRLAVADNERDREFGLMCVTHLRAHRGMIFVFATQRDWEFWMKNTLVPLDMIWVEADGAVTAIAANVPAVKRTTPDADLPRRRGVGTYVIELTANEARADGIVIGSQLVVPKLEGR